jgi:hypothetical protein
MRISSELRQKVLERDNFKCKYCGKKLDSAIADIDHVIPLKKGGTNDISNLVAACPLCNIRKADKLIEIVTTPVSKQLATRWVHSYLKAPILTIFLTLTITIGSGAIFYYLASTNKAKRGAERAQNLTYQAQINQLAQTEKNLKQLLQFIEQQKVNLTITEDSIAALKQEKDKLQPLVQSNREFVDALFRAQEERNRASIRKERWIGVGLGVLASLLASVFMLIVRYFVIRQKSA